MLSALDKLPLTVYNLINNQLILLWGDGVEFSDKQYDGQLIDEYYTLIQIRRQAEKENSTETVKLIDEKIEIIRLKLQPTILPE